jgi:hypothetical protein
MRQAGNVAFLGEIRNAYIILVEKLQGKKLLGSLRCRWEDNIKETGQEDVDLIHLTQDRDK